MRETKKGFSTMTCSKCGQVSESNFCSGCGTKLNQECLCWHDSVPRNCGMTRCLTKGEFRFLGGLNLDNTSNQNSSHTLSEAQKGN